MEGHGSGGPQMEVRVSKLEHVQEAQWGELKHLSGQMSAISADVSSLAAIQRESNSRLSDIADKLDATRMKRPDLQGSMAALSVIIVIASLALTPLYINQNKLEHRVERAELIQDERSYIIGKYEAKLEILEEQVDELEKAGLQMLGNRFTKEDGKRLEDKVDRHQEHDE